MSEAKAQIKKRLRFLMDQFLTKSVIEQAKSINSSFTLIRLRCLDLKELKAKPGDKVQIEVGGFRDRTYTPFDLDLAQKSFKILAYKRDDSPASQWLRTLKAGDSCEFTGPRGSVAIPEEQHPFAIFGDETTLGLIRALQTVQKNAVAFVETSHASDTKEAVAELQLKAEVVTSSEDESHLTLVGERMISLFKKEGQTKLILAGRAKSIQTLRAILTKNSIPAAQIKTKVYWADGKIGLD